MPDLKDLLTRAQQRGDFWKRMFGRAEADRARADKALDQATQRATAAEAVLTSIRAAIEALPDGADRTRLAAALAPSTNLPAVDWAQHIDRAVMHLRSIPIQCTALTGPVWYGAGWKDAIFELEEYADRIRPWTPPTPPPGVEAS
ncbi:hypothetical protein ABZ404_36975 [Streptomyces sp. NPDC005878]|uniref:hypothetical protein n=1 Tax=Streptomyces sp. NPDC005878 TaxID=3157077 RepID=UPI0033E2415A